MTYRLKCDCCQRYDRTAAPMFEDSTWEKLGKKDEWLCADCAFDRAIERKIELRFADLRPCSFNMMGHPQSWFAMFLKAEHESWDFDWRTDRVPAAWLSALVQETVFSAARRPRDEVRP